jgi:hypothetical protein
LYIGHYVICNLKSLVIFDSYLKKWQNCDTFRDCRKTLNL